MKNVSLLVLINFIFLLFFVNLIFAAEITNKSSNEKERIYINGSIENGDYNKFIESILKTYSRSHVYFQLASETDENKKNIEELNSKYGPISGIADVTVVINSSGGNVFESIKIGEAINKMALKTDISEINGKHSSCLSSCFFIWASGVNRSVSNKNKSNSIGIHRIYFDKKFYKNLSSQQVENEYKKVTKEAQSFLSEMRIPESLVEKLFNVPSNEVYWLTDKDRLNIIGKAPYWDEMLISKCGSLPPQEYSDFLECIIMRSELEEGTFANIPYLNKVKIIEKCDNLSDGYLSYIENNFLEINKCQDIVGGIERFNRIEKFLYEFGYRAIYDYKKSKNLVVDPPVGDTGR